MIGALAPAMLGLVALAALPVAIHLLTRRRVRQVPFPPLRLLRGCDAGRSRRSRLRDHAILALRAIALLAAVLAAAGLLWRGSRTADAQRPAVVIVDASASMRQQMQDGSAWQRARALAGRLVEKLSPRPVQVLVTGTPLQRSTPEPSSNPGDALALLAETGPGFGDGAPAEALATALAALPEGGDIHLITDCSRGSLAGIDPGALPDNIGLQVVDCGGGAANIAVRSIRIEPGLARVGQPCTVLAQVGNFGREPWNGQVHMQVGSHQRLQEVTIAPGMSTWVRLSLIPQRIDHLAVQTEILHQGRLGDALPQDDLRYAAVDVVAALPCAILSDDDPRDPTGVLRPLMAACTAAGLEPRLQDRHSETSGPGGGLLISAGLRDTDGAAAPIQAHLQAGGTWLQVIASDADAALAGSLPAMTTPVAVQDLIDITDQERGAMGLGQARLDHAMLTSFADRPELLHDLRGYRYRLTPAGQAADAAVLLQWADGTIAAAERPAAGGRWVVWNCSPAAIDSNMAASELLPLLTHDLLAALIPQRGGDLARPVGGTVTSQGWRDAEGQPLSILGAHSLLQRPGLYQTEEGALLAAAIPGSESDLRRVDPGLIGAEASDATASLAAVSTRPLWSWALFIALTCLALEGILLRPLRRRRTGVPA